MNSRDSKIIRYPRPSRLNIGITIFAVMLLYIAWNAVGFALRDKIEYYEVAEKTVLSSVDSFDALVLRSEEVVRSDANGYVNYYLRSGSRAAVGDIVCSIDEKGDYNSLLHSGLADLSPLAGFTGDDFDQLKSSLVSYSLKADKNDFTNVLDLKYGIESKLLSLLTVASDDNLVFPGLNAAFIHPIKASNAGLIEYAIDGMEDYDPSAITADVFMGNVPETSYSYGGRAVSEGDPLYKIIDSDTWSLIIPLNSEQAERYSRSSTLKAEFPDKGLSSYVRVSVFIGADGLFYANLSLSRYLPLFSDRRFTRINISKENEKGFLLPATAVGNLDCYVIPRSFAADKEDKYTPSFVIHNPDNPLSIGSVLSPRVVAATDDSYYIDPSSIEAGTVLKAYETQQTFTVGETVSVTGVLYVNRGFAQFRKVNILDKDGTYVIVQSGTELGITVSDRILTFFDSSWNNRVVSYSAS